MKAKTVAILNLMVLMVSTPFLSKGVLADEPVAVHTRKTPNSVPAQKKSISLPPLLKEVEAKYFKASTLIADFIEADQSNTTKQTKKSSGKIQFKRPGKLHWETLKPDHNILISDGKKFWFYTPPFDEGEAGQYIEKDASKVQTKFAQGLLAGTFSYNVSSGNMTVTQTNATDFIVIPKKGTGGTVKQATLKVDPQQKLITGVDLQHRGGNTSHITLSNIQLGKPLDDSLFHFTPPPNTEQMKD
ncbi:MAG: outer membrane lipoprotein chaperone LolA [Bdellovibrionia bacterium]